MYDILRHAHSGLRWLVLIALVIAIFNAFSKKGKPFTSGDKKLSLFALIFTHLQFVIGLILYFVSPKVVFAGTSMKSEVLRFYLVEHSLIMILAIVLITIGYSKAKRATIDAKKFKTIGIFYLIGLLLILAGIPWPFRDLGAGWF
ncbi:cytochrome B [Fulvivirga sp. RKSG066]|uniref:cytochrome B n=1 Tax=Fulvivirga aurantia TaxID=2529383 RepID=UPI0012BCA6C6|nr:cytochrome B [Fulvivirga aurantia]MTI22587.1 cytochrome B [Fulvivirga aurantia]